MSENSNRVLVTGATGFIGHTLVPVLCDSGISVNTLVRPGSEAVYENSDLLSIITGDICNDADLQKAMKGCSAVVNLAGVAHVDTGDKEALHKLNQGAPLALFRAAERQGLKRMVHISSSLAEEADAGRDNSAYARSKLTAERELKEAANNSQLELTIIRPVNVYGPGMHGNLAGMIRMIQAGRLPRLPRTTAAISLVGVEDLSRAILLALEKPQAAAKTYTVTDGRDYSLSELEAAIYAESGRKMPAWHSPRVLIYAASLVASLLRKTGLSDTGLSTRTYRNLVSNRIYSNTEICEELGFVPGTDFYRELPRILNAMEQEKASNPS